MTRRIHFLVPGPLDRLTGGSIYDARIAEELRRLGHDVEVHSLEGRFPWPDGAAYASAARALEAVRPGDALVVDGLAVAALDPTAPLPPDVPRILLVHMPLDEERGLPYGVRLRLRVAEDAWLSHADRVVCTSPVVAARMARRGTPERRIGVVEPGVDAIDDGRADVEGTASTADRLSEGEAARLAPGEPAPVRILSVGAVTRVKAHAVLVRALARLDHLPWVLEIVGSRAAEPATGAALRAEIDRRGLAGRVTLAGELPREAVREAYRRAHVFVLPSLFESYGMALAEAAAHGLPLVACEVGGIPATPAGRAARLVPPGDEAALARALEPLIADAGDRARLAAAAAAAALGLRSWAEAARDFAGEIRVAHG